MWRGRWTSVTRPSDREAVVNRLRRALEVWRKWALEPEELDALLWAEQDLELLADQQEERRAA